MKQTERIWRSGAKSFLKESYIEGIGFAFITGLFPLGNQSTNPGIRASERFSGCDVPLCQCPTAFKLKKDCAVSQAYSAVYIHPTFDLKRWIWVPDDYTGTEMEDKCSLGDTKNEADRENLEKRS